MLNFVFIAGVVSNVTEGYTKSKNLAYSFVLRTKLIDDKNMYNVSVKVNCYDVVANNLKTIRLQNGDKVLVAGKLMNRSVNTNKASVFLTEIKAFWVAKIGDKNEINSITKD